MLIPLRPPGATTPPAPWVTLWTTLASAKRSPTQEHDRGEHMTNSSQVKVSVGWTGTKSSSTSTKLLEQTSKWAYWWKNVPSQLQLLAGLTCRFGYCPPSLLTCDLSTIETWQIWRICSIDPIIRNTRAFNQRLRTRDDFLGQLERHFFSHMNKWWSFYF